MLTELARNWWVLLVRGILGVLLGIFAFIWPQLLLASLVLLFGAYAFVDGIFTLIGGFTMAGRQERWWVMVLEGVVGVVAGLVIFFYPGLAGLTLLYFIAFWALITGIFEIVAAIRLRKEIEGEWMLGLSGAASIIFGVLMLLQPAAGALAVAWIIGGYALVFGVVLIFLAFRVRGLAGQTAASSV
jgi:uncharacterized membrane protein HdeD (DUF308 family)